MTQPVIRWFRRDLRLQDNLALHEAIASGHPVIPLFIFDSAILTSPRTGAPRLAFMLKALEVLNRALKDAGSQLVIRHGNPKDILTELVTETHARGLYFNLDYSPFARKRDNEIQKTLDIEIHTHHDAILLPPGAVMKDNGDPYQVFTPFKKKWNLIEKPPISEIEMKPEHFAPLDNIKSDDIPTLQKLGFETNVPIPGADEDTAHQMLKSFIKNGIEHYTDQRNNLTIAPFADNREAGSSYLSPYLRLGMLSPRQVYWAAHDAYQDTSSKSVKKSIETYVSELTWREFYMHILYHYPHVDRHNFRREYDNLEWINNEEDLQAWKEGKTGYPIVDAPMRQLKAIGWIPNRARMIVASFLTKDLLVHWQYGELHFMQWLLDGDPAANNGGWQWAAGTGTDAQPYFRIFNPVAQSKKHNPDGTYIRHWIPELKNIPDKYIHTPWEMDEPPVDYPAPIVDHSAARERTLSAFKAIKEDD